MGDVLAASFLLCSYVSVFYYVFVCHISCVSVRKLSVPVYVCLCLQVSFGDGVRENVVLVHMASFIIIKKT